MTALIRIKQAISHLPDLSLSRPVLFLDRKTIRKTAIFFVENFPGDILYATKCLPEPGVIKELYDAGISGFDVSSIGEIEVVAGALKNAPLHYNNPIKLVDAIDKSMVDFGVRSFAVDCIEELEKFSKYQLSKEINISVRLAVETGSDAYDFSLKFGAKVDEAKKIIHRTEELGFNWGITFHVGSNCTKQMSFDNAFARCRALCSAVNKEPSYINIGGGFPAVEIPGPDEELLKSYFSEIRSASKKYAFPRLLCEPGRALVSSAGTLLTKVVLRKGNKIYLNDGIYGSFSETNYAKIALTPQAFLADQDASLCDFQIFGPTCDSFDAFDQKLQLPEKIETGDLVAFKNMGAYSHSIATQFNGFLRAKIVYI